MDCLRGPQHGDGSKVSKEYDSALLINPSPDARGGRPRPLSPHVPAELLPQELTGSSGPAGHQTDGCSCGLLRPCALGTWETRETQAVPTTSWPPTLRFSGPPGLTASLLSLLCDAPRLLQGDGCGQRSPSVFLPQPPCPHRTWPRLLAKQPAFSSARGPFGDRPWPAWLDVASFFSPVRSEEGGRQGPGAQLPPHRSPT